MTARNTVASAAMPMDRAIVISSVVGARGGRAWVAAPRAVCGGRSVVVVELDFDAVAVDGDVGVVAERVEEDVLEVAALDRLLQGLHAVVPGLVRALVCVVLVLPRHVVPGAGCLAEAGVA